MIVTVEQIRNLWVNGGSIDRGPHLPRVTQDDLGALASGIDTDDEGTPADEDQWAALADQINAPDAPNPFGSDGETLFDADMNPLRPATAAEVEWAQARGDDGWMWLDPDGQPAPVREEAGDRVVIDLGPVGGGGHGVGYSRPADGYRRVCVA